MSELPLDELARASLLLVASDFDGTVAPLAARPELAVADPQALAALTALAQLPQTHVAIVSGRPLAELERLAADPAFLRCGSHGAERGRHRGAASLDAAARERLAQAGEAARRSAARLEGAFVEEKPVGIAFHYRASDATAAATVVAELRAELAGLAGGRLIDGAAVLECTFGDSDKGRALRELRQRVGATAILFLGDDATDDDAFAALLPGDVGVGVGERARGPSHRVADIAAVAKLLAELAKRRAAFLAEQAALFPPIERHVLLSDQRAFALVAPSGRISWACLPRLDGSALFAELLGGPERGYFEVRPAGDAPPPTQRYLPDTLLLETQWPTFRVIDYLDASGGRAFQRAGRSDLLRVIEGSGRVRIAFAPAVSFGRAPTRLVAADEGLVIEGVRESCVLRAPGIRFDVRSAGRHDVAVAEFELGREPVVLELRYGTRALVAAPDSEPRRRERTAAHWSAWAATLSLPTIAREPVLRSALTLRALTYGPNGAIAAAATTSLPEQLGGVRNWDYRLCWPRDAAHAAAALVQLGATGPALKLLDWLLGLFDAMAAGGVLAPVYTVSGGNVAAEGELPELSGYRGSKPVRLGNLASEQLQLDVYGPIVELLALLAARGAPLSFDHWRMTEAIAETVRLHWREPDHGIWEVRGPLRHHVHTKATCWQAIDRACRVASYLGRECEEWQQLRTEIAVDLLAHGPRAGDGSFGAAYGGEEADAAALWVGLTGLLPPDDARFVATVERVERELLERGGAAGGGAVVRRYRVDDGLPGIEGGFNFCTTWLVRAWLLQGRVAEAAQLFEEFCALAGPQGLLAEEHDVARHVALGNFPQAYSHAGLIECAVALDAARRR
ncbi:MAG: trehalose-phosphatase [Planctomycetes bacterium]|nr:trehalose-phosphatase [Planctomycetota bacterium]